LLPVLDRGDVLVVFAHVGSWCDDGRGVGIVVRAVAGLRPTRRVPIERAASAKQRIIPWLRSARNGNWTVVRPAR